jgi:hypothetical protein
LHYGFRWLNFADHGSRKPASKPSLP